MKKLSIIIITVLFFSFANAQVSGYMGKKFAIIYSAGIGFPHFTNLGGKFEVLPTINHSLNIEYVIGNSVVFGGGYKLAMNAGLNSPEHFVLQGFEERYKFYSHTFAPYFKFYKRNSLAPIGGFTKLGLGIQNLVLLDNIKPNNEDYKSTSSTTPITMQNYSKYDIVFLIGGGRNWIIADRVLLGFQIETGFTPASIYSMFILDDLTSSQYNKFNGSSLRSSIVNRFNFTNELLKVSLNIGFLAF